MNEKIDCLIIGLGLIGGSFALSLRKSFPDSKIYGYDLKKKSLDTAFKKKIIDKKFTFENKHYKINLIIVAVPLLKAVEIFKEISTLNFLKDAIIFDLSSSKRVIHDEIRILSKAFLKKRRFMSSNCWLRKIWNQCLQR